VIDRARLMSAQEAVVAGLLGTDVKVVADTDVPHADLKNRVMHIRPLPEEVSADDLLHLRADVDHEMGHFGATDVELIESVDRPLLKMIFNTVEDGFIERWVSARWLGCAQNLKESNRKIIAQIKAARSSAVENKRARAISALQSIAFGIDKNKVIDSLGDDIAPLIAQVDDLLADLPKIQNTAMSLVAAKKILDRWSWADPKPRSQPTPDASDDEPSQDGESSPGSDPDSSARYEGEHRFKQREDRLAKRVAVEGGVSDARKASIKAMSFPPRRSYLPYTDEDHVGVLIPTPGDRSTANEFANSVRRIVPPLRRRLLMEFRGADFGTTHNQPRGEIDRGRLWEVPLGVETIFEQEKEQIVTDADVTLLVDASGSMKLTGGKACPETRLYIAAQAACAFSMVLDLIGVPHECLAFTTRHTLGRHFKSFNRSGFDRVRPLQHLVVKDAKQRWRQSRESFAALANWDGCCENIDGESVMWAARRLADRNRPGMKPILIVFSDGSPSSVPEDADVLHDHLKRSVERIEAAGITTLGVGICSRAVQHFYSDHVVIEQVADLVGTSYNVIRAVLRSARRRT
jgi:cobalamin biosynthesis protein CobT